MVRLKVSVLFFGQLIIRVSIPYGSIKSSDDFGNCSTGMFQFLMVRLKGKGKTKFNNLFEFQFLMVRLKDWLPGCSFYRTAISIPYGSIKSDFLSKMDKNKTYFNSLWFD